MTSGYIAMYVNDVPTLISETTERDNLRIFRREQLTESVYDQENILGNIISTYLYHFLAKLFIKVKRLFVCKYPNIENYRSELKNLYSYSNYILMVIRYLKTCYYS